jgi:L-asparaginase II
MAFAPIARVVRGPLVESEHRGIVVVADASGAILARLGDATHVTFPRSSLKPFQALALIESGAADAYRLDDRHLALACASHRGEPFHIETVRRWLDAIDCREADLACGAEPPDDAAAWEAMLRAGELPTRLHHNCSGKHAGFLCVCRHCGWPRAGYDDPAHPGQRRYLETMSDILETDASALPQGRDGCTLPAIGMSMEAMALATARFAARRSASPTRRSAMERLLGAMRAHPAHASGTGQPMVRLAEATGGRVLMKSGAEGFAAVWLPDPGIGIALKIADGGGRARLPVLVELLAELDLIDAGEQYALAAERRPIIHDSRGRPVGHLEAWLDDLRR